MENILVAKSYKDLPKEGDVFISGGKSYINVRLKSGKIKAVRVYSETEYNKMYPELAVGRPADRKFKPQKEVLGFTKGYITIFKGDTYAALDWFRASNARYARFWGWYIISTEEIPTDLPEGVEPVQLPWELVGQEDGYLKPDHIVKEGVESIIYTGSNSKYVGAIGERLDLHITVEKAIELDGAYGRSTMFLMRDENENLYVWTTTAKNWEPGTKHHIRGTVKDHRKYRNECQTVLTRCLEQKTA